MDVKTILDYIYESPENTNPNILGPMLEELKASGEKELWTITFKGDTYDYCGFGWEQQVMEEAPERIKTIKKQFLAGSSITNLEDYPMDYNMMTGCIGYTTADLDTYYYESEIPEEVAAKLVSFPYTPSSNNEVLKAVYLNDN